MNALPMPRRLLKALQPPPGEPPRRIEPVLDLGAPPPTSPPAPARRAVETALEAGSRRVYAPMQEAEILEARRR